jgi:hypothetical protein
MRRRTLNVDLAVGAAGETQARETLPGCVMGNLPHQYELFAEEQVLNLAFSDGAPHSFTILLGEPRSERDVRNEFAFSLRWECEDIPDRLVAGLMPPNEPRSPRHADVEVFFRAGICDPVIRNGTNGQATDSCTKRADKLGFAAGCVQLTGADQGDVGIGWGADTASRQCGNASRVSRGKRDTDIISHLARIHG